MKPPCGRVELLREIRYGQRELLALTTTWIERANTQYQEWQRAQAGYEARVEREQPLVKRWEEANELWLMQQRRAKRVTIVVTALGLAGLAVAGILAATGCFD